MLEWNIVNSSISNISYIRWIQVLGPLLLAVDPHMQEWYVLKDFAI